MKPDICLEHLRYEYRPEEIKRMGQDLAEAYNTMRQIEEEEAEMKADIKSRKSRVELAIGDLSRKITQQFEMRNVECRMLWHSPTPAFVTIVRSDTGEVVKERQMTMEERQELLPFDDNRTRVIPKPELVRGALADVGEEIALAEVAKFTDADLVLALEWAQAFKKWLEHQQNAMADPSKDAGEAPKVPDRPLCLEPMPEIAPLQQALYSIGFTEVTEEVIDKWSKAERMAVNRYVGAILWNERGRNPETEEAEQVPDRPEVLAPYKRMDPEPPQADEAQTPPDGMPSMPAENKGDVEATEMLTDDDVYHQVHDVIDALPLPPTKDELADLVRRKACSVSQAQRVMKRIRDERRGKAAGAGE